MKEKKLLILFILLLLINCCKKESSDLGKDIIKITSVTPSNGLIDGQETDFHIEGNYTLSSHESGLIMFGFNDAESVTYICIRPNYLKIEKGTGQFSIDGKATVIDRGNQDAFLVGVFLVSAPQGTEIAEPLTSFKFELIPKTN